MSMAVIVIANSGISLSNALNLIASCKLQAYSIIFNSNTNNCYINNGINGYLLINKVQPISSEPFPEGEAAAATSEAAMREHLGCFRLNEKSIAACQLVSSDIVIRRNNERTAQPIQDKQINYNGNR